MNPKKVLQSKNVIITFVCLVFGFMVSFSFHMTKIEKVILDMTSSQFVRDMALRDQLIVQQEKNQKLQNELAQKQQKILRD